MDLPPTINLPVVAELMGVNLNLMRDMVNSGEFPVKPMHIGERRVFPTAAVLRLLGLDVTAA
jgi:predicted DNA-binding transcriptional regulator AlpA